MFMAGCAAPTPTTPSTTPKSTGQGKQTVKATPDVKPVPSPSAAAPLPLSTPTGLSTPAASVLTPLDPALNARGLVRGLDGNPAAGIRIVARVLSNNGSAVIANNGGNMVANNGAGLVANTSGGYVILQAAGEAIETTSDAQGRFAFKAPTDVKLTVEAIRGDQEKAIALAVSTAGEIALQLAPTGSLAGKLSAPTLPSLTNFEGFDVFLPGTGYLAKAAADGSWRIENVPIGTFTLVATKTGVGRAEATGVTVKAKETASAVLGVGSLVPILSALQPALARAGGIVRVQGSGLGISRGAAIAATAGGIDVGAVKVIDEGTLEITLPLTAKSGDFILKVDGKPSNALPLVVTQLAADVKTMTLAGYVSGNLSSYNHDGEGLSATFSRPAGVAIAPDGRIVVADEDNLNLRILTLGAGSTVDVKTLAGPDEATNSGAPPYRDGRGTTATFGSPGAMAFGPDGKLYVRDGPCIRVVSLDGQVGVVSTFAGDPRRPGGDDGELAKATFMRPSALAFDAAGDLFVADSEAHTIRKIAMSLPVRTITTIAGLVDTPDLANGDGAIARFNAPNGLAFGRGGALYVMDAGNTCLRRLTFAGGRAEVNTVAGGDAEESVDGVGQAIRFSQPVGLAADADGDLFLLEYADGLVRRVALGPDGVPTSSRLAGGGSSNDGPKDGFALGAYFDTPTALTVDRFGNLVVLEGSGARVRRVARYDY